MCVGVDVCSSSSSSMYYSHGDGPHAHTVLIGVIRMPKTATGAIENKFQFDRIGFMGAEWCAVRSAEGDSVVPRSPFARLVRPTTKHSTKKKRDDLYFYCLRVCVPEPNSDRGGGYVTSDGR